MSVSVSFRASPTLSRDLAGMAVPMLTALALRVETEAKRNAPVKTGNLRRSITSSVEVGPVPTGIVAATAHYAAFVELGTRLMNPRPFLRRALLSVIR